MSSPWDDMFDDPPQGPLSADSTTFENIQVLRETEKAWQVKFSGCRPHWVPKKQSRVNIPDGTIEVTDWLLGKWAEEGFDPEKGQPEACHQIPGCICLRETEAAVWVEVPDKGRLWFPKSHVLEASEVKEDGDTGTLVISEWLAKEKGLIGSGADGALTALDDIEGDNE